MAIADIPVRLAFLNRGQGRAVCKLKTLLPNIRDEAIHADLTAIVGSHEQNIGLITAKPPLPASEGGFR
jgi:nitronate monooxygenase